ncbi:MAG: cAMP phosphodiesterase class-II:metallo-beta-lactamase superfamily protein [Nitrosomonas sp.]|jgi:ribonuclease BN (tRNA processing enzyme)|nr:MAG: cAMP phosphodiesterase class-II:metallo-beta-lactamase superfamily protein [Nitrosomonas sp.]
MKLKILGCSGGIGSGAHTSSMLLDEDILIDAGTGVGELDLDNLKLIDHIFVTHSHLDHVVSIPFLVDTVGCMREKPITIYANQQTLEILKQHLFNWAIWPDFTRIPNSREPYMRYQPISVGETVNLQGRKITALPANHTVPATGFQLDSGQASLVFTGDTTTNDEIWKVLNKIENLRYLIIETAFCNQKKDIAVRSKHLCPSMLAAELEKLEQAVEIYITHLKQGEAAHTMREIKACAGKYNPRRLMNNQIFKF